MPHTFTKNGLLELSLTGPDFKKNLIREPAEFATVYLALSDKFKSCSSIV